MEHSSSPQQPESSPSRRSFMTTAAVAGLVAFVVQRLPSQSLDISGSEEEVTPLILPEIPLNEIAEKLEKNVTEGILDDPEFHDVHKIHKYILDYLTDRGIRPIDVSVQVIPFRKNEAGNLDYLEISVTTSTQKLTLILATDNTEVIPNAVNNMMTNFQTHVEKATLTVFKQEIESNDYFSKPKIKKALDAVLEFEFRTHVYECYEYLGAYITRNDNSKATIFIKCRNKLNDEISHIEIETDISIPSPDYTYEPPLMAQNTSETQQ